MYMDWTYILVLIGLGLGLWAQASVKQAYAEQSRVRTQRGEAASEVVRDMLLRNGNTAVMVKPVGGELTDHYNPADETLNLSQGVFASDSVAALGIAAHEAGHAMQKMTGYSMLALRTAAVPVVNIGSTAAMPVFIAGLIFSWSPLISIGIILFSFSVVFALITLPVEFDASRRAMQMLTSGGYITSEEERGVRKVLRAAAMTYVASAVASMLNLLRLILISNRRRR